jgi:hypothetical protein
VKFGGDDGDERPNGEHHSFDAPFGEVGVLENAPAVDH